MSETTPTQCDNVSVICKPNVYFGGKVISYTVHFADGSKKTLGVIQAGEYKFGTEAPEKMEIVGGTSQVRLAGESEWKTYAAGTTFKVPGQSSFEIIVPEGVAEYICSYE